MDSMPTDPRPARPARWRLLAEVHAADLDPALVSAMRELDLPAARLAQLQSAVAEASGHARQLDGAGARLRVFVAGGAEAPPPGRPGRGWGFFIIETSGPAEAGRGLELFLYREGALPAAPEA